MAPDLGQFGFVGLLLVCSTLSAPILCLLSDKRYLQQRVSVPLASIVSMAIADALLNSFFFYPAILAAGALAGNSRAIRTPETMESSSNKAGMSDT
jgi:hypothetical protein